MQSSIRRMDLAITQRHNDSMDSHMPLQDDYNGKIDALTASNSQAHADIRQDFTDADSAHEAVDLAAHQQLTNDIGDVDTASIGRDQTLQQNITDGDNAVRSAFQLADASIRSDTNAAIESLRTSMGGRKLYFGNYLVGRSGTTYVSTFNFSPWYTHYTTNFDPGLPPSQFVVFPFVQYHFIRTFSPATGYGATGQANLDYYATQPVYLYGTGYILQITLGGAGGYGYSSPTAATYYIQFFGGAVGTLASDQRIIQSGVGFTAG